MLPLVRFFRVSPPNTVLMTAAFAVATVVSAASIALRPERAAEALQPILLLQLFAASSGFLVPARRGHYDLVLTSGRSRIQIGAVHWVMSVWAGVASWLVLAAIELVVAGARGAALLSTGSITAVCIVSTLPWAGAVRLPRFAMAIGWLTAGAMLSTLDLGPHIAPAAPASAPAWVERAMVALVYPWVLVGRDLRGEALTVVPGLTTAAGAFMLALASIHRRDIPLEASQ
jgi:hypothetical protein